MPDETRICTTCQASFTVYESDRAFYERIGPIFGGVRYPFPAPEQCPECRHRLRLAFRNERKLYHRKCDLSGRVAISMYSSESPYTMYHIAEWESDRWNPLDYGHEFDFSRPFFEQFAEVRLAVPRPSLLNVNHTSFENAEHNNYAMNMKNAYLNFSGTDLEDTYYTTDSFHLRDSMDVWWSADLQRCYECTNTSNLYDSLYCANCADSTFLAFCEECNDCSYCLFCYGLKNRTYCINNTQYTPEEYEREGARYLRISANIPKFQIRFRQFVAQQIHPYMHGEGSEKVTGDYLYGCYNCQDCYHTVNVRDSRYVYSGGRTADIYDGSGVYGGEGGVYQAENINDSARIAFSQSVSGSSFIAYSDTIIGCHDIFGSVGLRNAQHVILNRQYTQSEYEALVPKIIEHMQKTGEWGRYFPASSAMFGYNETLAMEEFPLPKDIALAKGWRWADYEPPIPKVTKTIPASRLPTTIDEVPDDILNWAIECEVTGRPFRLIAPELAYYRSHHLPVPRRHPDQRHLDRMTLRNPRRLYGRKCDKCRADMQTTYAPERTERVYCRTCYLKEVYG